MNLNDRLDRLRDEVGDEVASDVRVPSFDAVLARRAHRRRLQATAGGAALVVVAAGVVGGVAATRPDPSRSVPPAATVSASPPPTAATSPPASASPTTSATTAPTSAQTYPAKGSSYVVVPDGDQLAWTDLKTGAHGHFGPSSGQVSSPSVSADGRRVAYVVSGATTETGTTGPTIAVWDLDTRRAITVSANSAAGVLAPSISPDGTRVIWYSATSGIQLATVGHSPGYSPDGLVPSGSATWDGNGALAYLPAPGSRCAVERFDLATKATTCLLPTATLQSVFSADGSTWQIDSISGSADGSLLALGVTTTDQKQRGIGLLRTSAEATPFRVVPSTVTTDVPGPPVLIDGGTRLLYQEGPVGGNARVVSVDVATGAKATVATSFLGSSALGLGATSG